MCAVMKIFVTHRFFICLPEAVFPPRRSWPFHVLVGNLLFLPITASRVSHYVAACFFFKVWFLPFPISPIYSSLIESKMSTIIRRYCFNTKQWSYLVLTPSYPRDIWVFCLLRPEVVGGYGRYGELKTKFGRWPKAQLRFCRMIGFQLKREEEAYSLLIISFKHPRPRIMSDS